MAVEKGVALSTIGVEVRYGMETTAGNKPTAFSTVIPDIKSTPELNPAPDALETTVLAEPEYKTYIQGLKDLGGDIPFTANLTSKLMGVWEGLVSAQATGKATGLRPWLEIIHPDLEKAVFFQCEVAPIGLPAMEVNSVLEIELHVTPTSAPEWDDKIVK